MTKLPQFFLSYPLVPGEKAVDGICFDFCDGCRVLFPRGKGEHRVMLTDNDSDVVIEDVMCCDGAKFRSKIRYYVNWKLDIYRNEELIFTHSLDLSGKEVFFMMNTDAIGDTIAWFSYVDKFQKKHNCKVGIVMWKKLREIIEPEYPNIKFFDRGAEKILQPYASYFLGINYECEQHMQKRAFNSMPLHHLIGSDLGFDNELDIEPPMVSSHPDAMIKEPYVCLSVKGSMACKCWNNETAITEVVSYLKDAGYRVLLVDRENTGLYGAEDFTGDRPLIERTTLFKNAKLFIGVSSGLSWLAWACRVPVVLISGFTEPWVEFNTPYKVQNSNVCHGCWNKQSNYYYQDSLDKWCPEHKDFECTRKITSKLALTQIKLALGDNR